MTHRTTGVMESAAGCITDAAINHPLDQRAVLRNVRLHIWGDDIFPDPLPLTVYPSNFPDVGVYIPLVRYETDGSIDRPRLARDATHELTRVIDRQSSELAFDRTQFRNISRDVGASSFLLWDVWIAGRLTRVNRPSKTFAECRAAWMGNEDSRAGDRKPRRLRLNTFESRALERLWSTDQVTFRELVDLAKELTPTRIASLRRGIRRQWASTNNRNARQTSKPRPTRTHAVVPESVRQIAQRLLSTTDPIVELADFAPLLAHFETFFDTKWLAVELRNFDAWVRTESDPMLVMRLLHRPPSSSHLVAAIWATREWLEIRRDDPSFEPPIGVKCLVTVAADMATMQLAAGNWFNDAARRALRHRLEDSAAYGVLHECETFAFFARKRLNPIPRFFVNSSRDEITCSWRRRKVPVQCKVREPGAGRSVSRQVVSNLASLIARDLKSMNRGQVVIRIRTSGPVKDFPRLRSIVRTLVRDLRGTTLGPVRVLNDDSAFAVTVSPESRRFARDQLRAVLSEFGAHRAVVIAEPVDPDDGSRQQVEALLLVSTDTDENPWRGLWSTIRRAAWQLAGGPPGLIALHFADPVVSANGLLPGEVDIGEAIHNLLNGLPQVAGVLISSEPDLQEPIDNGPAQVRAYFREERLPPEFPLGVPMTSAPIPVKG